MFTTMKRANGLSLAALFAGAAMLGWAAIANAQGAIPTAIPNSSPAAPPEANPINGTPFGGPSPSTTTNPFGGGLPNFGGGPANNQFRGGFNGTWLAPQTNLTGNNYRTNPASAPSSAPGGQGSGAFSGYYVNPWAAGAPGVSSLAPFNAPIYRGGASGMQGGPYSPANTPFNTPPNTPPGAPGNVPSAAARRGPSYTASLDDHPAARSRTTSEVERMLARSSSLSPHRDIRVDVEGSAIVLRGTVAREADRRLAEALVRLTPGLYVFRNELEVAGKSRRRASGP